MAGFRTFATGEVLTAANVNDFLMKQSVMVFDDATARTAALGAEVAEGMLTFNKDTGALEVFDGSAFVPAGAEPPAGIGSNVVQTVKTDPFTTTSASFVIVTGLTATITPTSATSKVLVIAEVPFNNSTSNRSGFSVFQGSTNLVVPASPGNRTPVAAMTDSNGLGASGSVLPRFSFMFLHSPATTSATEYNVKVRATGAVLTAVNRSTADSPDAAHPRSVATITLIEVAA